MLYDIIVLGGGPGGYLAAERAGHAGLDTLLIEKNMLGGVCLNEGCIPSKTLLHSAKIFDYMTGYGKKYGVSCENPKLDHSFVIERKNKVVKTLVSGVAATMKKYGVEVIKGEGMLKGKTAEGINVSVNGETYTGKRLIIATGSQAMIPPIPGLKDEIKSGFALTSREILNLKEVPEKLVIVGGGVVGLEMAAYFQSAGSMVTVIDMLPQIAGVMDAEITGILQKHYSDRGMTFYLGASVTAIEPNGVVFDKDGVRHRAECDKTLISIGRRAVTQGFGLESLNVLTEKIGIKVDDQYKTNIPNVFAVGDCNGRSMLAHSAYRQAEVAVNNILGKKDIMRYGAVPGVVYTNPEIATVGLTEENAKAQGIDCSTVKLPMRFSGRYLAENEGGNGICKLIFNKKYKTLIGAHIIGGPASEFILSCGMMIETEMTTDSIKELIFPHPTVCEIIREAIFSAEL